MPLSFAGAFVMEMAMGMFSDFVWNADDLKRKENLGSRHRAATERDPTVAVRYPTFVDGYPTFVDGYPTFVD
jgi:hypothetical protein